MDDRCGREVIEIARLIKFAFTGISCLGHVRHWSAFSQCQELGKILHIDHDDDFQSKLEKRALFYWHDLGMTLNLNLIRCTVRAVCYLASSYFCATRFLKRKDHAVDIAPLGEWTALQKRSGMARVVEGFHSFTCTPMRLSTNGMNHTCLCLRSRSWSSFTDPGGMEDWVGLGTTTVSKQFAQDRHVTAMTVVSCSSRHASMGNWSTGKHPTHDLSSRNSRR